MTGKQIANNIRAERNRANLTQAEVANRLGVSIKTYIEYEEDASKIRLDKLLLLKDIFNCSVNDFYLEK